MDKLIDFFKTPEGFTGLIIFVFFLTIYLIAYRRSQRDDIVILNGKKDYYTLALILVLSVFTLFFSKDNSTVEYFYGGLFLISILCVYTIYLTYIGNLGYPNRIVIAICAKIFILSIIIVIFFLRIIEYTYAELEENKNKRYKDGTKGNLIIFADKRNRRYTDRFIKNLIK